jgi:hypothetical protein
MKEDVSLEDGVLPPQGPMAQQNSPPLTVLARTHSFIGHKPLESIITKWLCKQKSSSFGKEAGHSCHSDAVSQHV